MLPARQGPARRSRSATSASSFPFIARAWRCRSGSTRTTRPRACRSTAFALFCGIAMSITAFPVLARILEERHLTHTPLGTTAITCAAVDDVTAWSILAFVVAIATAGGAMRDAAGDRGAVGGVRARDDRWSAAPSAARRCDPDTDRRHAQQGAPGDRPAGAAVVGARHRDHRHPCALRCVRRRRHHAGRRHVPRRPSRSAGEHQLGVPAAALLRLHRPAHADRPARRRRRAGRSACAIIVVATTGKLGGTVARGALDRPARGATRSRSAR